MALLLRCSQVMPWAQLAWREPACRMVSQGHIPSAALLSLCSCLTAHHAACQRR